MAAKSPPVKHEDWLEPIQKYPLCLDILPTGSFYIQFEFTLLKPYISRDDNQFYIIDNPIVRDKVFRCPMVRPTSWKGALRHALWQLGYQKEDEQIQRLFGIANDDQPEAGNAGRLYFYPSFFTKTSLEIINPHDRKRRVGKNPILIESVPIGATATFTLLYTPLDRIGNEEAETRRQVFADLELVADGLQAMFTVYGFGAKTSSGFGVADITDEGQLVVHYPDKKVLGPKPEEPTLPKAVKEYFANEPEGEKYLHMKPKKLKDEGIGTSKIKRIKNIKPIYKQYEKDLDQYQKELEKWENIKNTPPPNTQNRSFISFKALSETIVSLREKGGTP